MSIRDIFYREALIQEALKIVKKLKDRLEDGDESAFKYLNIGQIKNFTIKKSKHLLNARGEVRRDKGVPEDFIIEKIKEVFKDLSSKKNNVVIFKYKDRYNMLVLAKDTRYNQIVIKTEILQNRKENTFKYKNNDKAIISEKYEDLKFIFI